MPLTDNEKYERKFKGLDQQYKPWGVLYEDISKYIWPTGGNYTNGGLYTEDPDVRSNTLIDIGEYSNKILGAGMQSGLSSPSRPWFRLSLLDTDLANFRSVKAWLSNAEQVMYKVLAGSNYYESAHAGFEEQGAFGTECMFFESHADEIIRFYPFTAGEYRIAYGADKKIDTIYRQFQMTAIQMVTKFGVENVSDAVKKALDRSPYSYFPVLHCVEPREQRDPSKADPANMAWKSIWIEPGQREKQLRESGYPYFPAVVSRWATRGPSPYGFGPGGAALGSSKLIQEFERTSLQGLHQMVEPAMVAPAKYKGVLDLTPGAVNYDSSTEKMALRRLFEINLPIRDLESKTAQVERRIEKSFYNDMFLIITQMDRSNVTATEVLERKEEKLLMLGPTIERQIKEKLDPTVTFVFNEVNRRGLLPPPPKEMQGKPLKIEYVSLLAQAQKLITAQGLRAYMAEVERLAAVDPNTTVKTDFDSYLEQYGDSIGVPPGIIRTSEEVNEIREAQQAAAQQAAQAEQQMQQAAMAKDLGQASVESNTALGALKEDMSL